MGCFNGKNSIFSHYFGIFSKYQNLLISGKNQRLRGLSFFF